MTLSKAVLWRVNYWSYCPTCSMPLSKAVLWRWSWSAGPSAHSPPARARAEGMVCQKQRQRHPGVHALDDRQVRIQQKIGAQNARWEQMWLEGGVATCASIVREHVPCSASWMRISPSRVAGCLKHQDRCLVQGSGGKWE